MNPSRFTLHHPQIEIPRWIARAVGLLLALLIFGVFVAYSASAAFWNPLEIFMAFMLGIVWLGLLFGWYNELWGGFAICFGGALFCVLSWIEAGTIALNWIWMMPLLLLPGILFLYVGLKKRPPDYT